MKKQILFLYFVLLFHVAIGQQQDELLAATFDKMLSEQFKADGTGATALVARNGQIIYTNAIGMANLELNQPMQVDNVFRIGSITKQFTAIAILQLMEQGKLNLQDEITKFIPDYPVQGATITIEHLLTHTSGIQSFTAMKDYIERMRMDVTPVEMIDHFKNEPMKFEPGTQWTYNNSGYFLLGHIIEVVTGKSYAEYLEENFFKPLGMTHSLYGSDTKIIKKRAGTYSEGEQGYENAMPLSMTQPFAAGSIQSTVEDLFKWNMAVQTYKLVTKESLDKAFTRYKLKSGEETNYGYGWGFGYIQGSPTVEHGGGINGATTMAIYLPREDVFVAVFTNCDCYSPKDIASRMAAVAIGNPYDYKEITLEDAILQEYTGVYETEKGEVRIITVSENKLYSQRGKSPKFIMKARQKDKFFVDDTMLTLDFSRNKKGKVDKLTTQSRERYEVWNKTDKPIPAHVEINVDEEILDSYLGEYEIEPTFTFVVTKEEGKLFIQATEQEKFEILPETETQFFSTVNDAQFEFIKDDSGTVTKASLKQGGRTTEAKKIK